MEQASQITEITLDLSHEEIVVVAALANLGVATMCQDLQSSLELHDILDRHTGAERLAKSAMDKLHSTLKLAHQVRAGALS